MQIQGVLFEKVSKSFPKRRSIGKAAYLVALLMVVVAAASGQYLLSDDIVAQFLKAEPILSLGPRLSSVLPGVSLLVLSGVLLAVAARRANGSAIAEPRPGTRHNSAWLVVLEFAACFVGLDLATYLLMNLLAGTYRPDFPMWYLRAILALGVAFLCNDLRQGISLYATVKQVAKTWALVQLAFLLVMSAMFIYLSARDLTGEFYAAIGDEYAFFYFAKGIAQGTPANLFSQKGVYGYHPIADSAYQALVMNQFGTNQFGWKFAGVLLVAVSLFPLYFLARHFFGVWTAAMATGITATSHYLIAYTHTGYNNIHALLPTLVAAWAGAVGVTRRSSFMLFVAGVAAGLGFYTFFTARLAIAALLLAVLTSRFRLSTIRLLFSATVGFVVAVFPIFAVSKMDVINAMLANSPAKGDTGWTSVAQEVYQRTLDSMLLYNYNTATGRFVVGSLLDPISAALMAIGVIFAVTRLHDWRYRYLLIWLAIGLIITGGFNHGTNIAETRLMLLVPFLAIFAGAAVDRLVRATVHNANRRVLGIAMPPVVLAALLIAVLLANIDRFWSIMPKTLPLRGESLALKVVRDTEFDHSVMASVVVLAPAPDALARLVFDAHELGYRNPILLSAGEKEFAGKYFDSPAIAFIEMSADDVKATLNRLKEVSPDVTFTEEWDPAHKRGIAVLRNSKPIPSAGPAAPAVPNGLRAVLRLGTQGMSPGRVDRPRGVAVDEQRNIYVADTGNHRIQKFDAGGKLLLTFGGDKQSPGYLTDPISIAADKAGTIAVADGKDLDIKIFDSGGRFLSKTSRELALSRPQGITFDSQSNLYVADAGRLLKLGPDGRLISMLAGGPGADSRPQLKSAADVAIDASGNIYVLDGASGTIHRLDPQGQVISQWATPATGLDSLPRLEVGPDGTLVVLVPQARRVLRYDVNGQLLWDLNGRSVVGEKFGIPAGLAVDKLGYVYTADAGTHQVVRFAFF